MIYGGKNGFADLKEVVFKAHSTLSAHLDKFDSIAATGVSGITVAAPLAVLLNKPLVVVRKKEDTSTHSSTPVEGHLDMGRRVLFVDDFVSGGSTRARVWSAIREASNRAELVGQYMYNREAEVRWYDARDHTQIKYDAGEIDYDAYIKGI